MLNNLNVKKMLDSSVPKNGSKSKVAKDLESFKDELGVVPPTGATAPLIGAADQAIGAVEMGNVT